MMLAFVCLVLLCVCVVPGATVRQCVVHCLLVTPCTLLSLSPFLPVCTSSFPFIHQTSFSRQRLSLDATYAAFLVAPVRRHASRHFPQAVSGARCFPQPSAERVASLMTISLSPSPAFSLFVPSCSKPALPLFPRSFSLSRSHTLHTHTLVLFPAQ